MCVWVQITSANRLSKIISLTDTRRTNKHTHSHSNIYIYIYSRLTTRMYCSQLIRLHQDKQQPTQHNNDNNDNINIEQINRLLLLLLCKLAYYFNQTWMQVTVGRTSISQRTHTIITRALRWWSRVSFRQTICYFFILLEFLIKLFANLLLLRPLPVPLFTQVSTTQCACMCVSSQIWHRANSSEVVGGLH